jgi:hypothetical protein
LIYEKPSFKRRCKVTAAIAEKNGRVIGLGKMREMLSFAGWMRSF